MESDKKMAKWMLLLIIAPLALAIFGGDRFRYPCQDPANWDSQQCKLPTCDVTRTCPEHIFKGQRDPRLGPPKDELPKTTINQTPAPAGAAPVALDKGANCGK
jgi:hypothetical protein